MKIKKYKFVNTLIKYIETNISLIFLQGYEAEILEAIRFIKNKNLVDKVEEFSLVTEGVSNEKRIQLNEFNQLKVKLMFSLHFSFERKDNTLLIVHGAEGYLNENNSEIIDILNRIAQLTNNNKFSANLTIIFSGKEYEIPNLLKENSMVMKKALPTEKEIEFLIKEFLEKNKILKRFYGNNLLETHNVYNFINIIKERVNGLNEIEINQLLRFLYYENGIQLIKNSDSFLSNIDKEIRRLKVQKLIKLGTLTIESPNVSLDDVRGLENLKSYIKNKKVAINSHNKLNHFNITMPKGILLLGEPGTGKSLSAKAIANYMDIELIKFDISQILGKYVGESEKRMRQTLEIVQYMSPCILWIDEIEKAFAGVNKDNNEIMRKVFGQLLTWMSENNKGVFVVATANNIEGILPPEFLRKGRFDEVFYIDRPSIEEREDIIKLHLAKRKIDINYIEKNYKNNIDKLVNESDSLVGADLEYCCNEFAIQYHISDENKYDDEPAKFEKCFSNMLKNIKEIKSKNKKKGSLLSLEEELKNLEEQWSREIKIVEKNQNGKKSVFNEITSEVLKNNINEKIDILVKNLNNRNLNRELYKPATSIKKKS